MINKILISGDLLRPKIESGKTINFHEKRINKYFEFLKYQLEESTNLSVHKLNTDNTSFSPSIFYKLCGGEYLDDEEWLKIYDLSIIPQNAIDYFSSYIADSIVIYIEMPQIFKRIHNFLNIPYIDITVHPIRFYDDHLFGMSTNSSFIFDRMKKYQINEKLFNIQANAIKAITAFNPYNILPNSALIAGQTNIDKALYNNGRCLSIMDYEDEIRNMGHMYDCVYYKAHPYNKELGKIYSFLKQFDFIKLCPSDWNTYRIISNDNLKKVYAITSGVLYEAPYFGKEVRFLHRPCFHFDYDLNCPYSEETYLSIYNDFINPVFWKDCFQDLISVNNNCENLIMSTIPNRIRATFNDYWSYTDLDPTIITASKLFRKKSEEKSINRPQSYVSKEVYDNLQNQVCLLQNEVRNLETTIGILRNEPAFENNPIKRYTKTKIFSLAQTSVFFNPDIVLYKLSKVAKSNHRADEKITSIKGITYRPHAPHGGRGGGGAVLSAMESIIGNDIKGFPITYNYSEKDGIWHTLKNRYFTYSTYNRMINPKSNLIPLYAAVCFVIEKTKNEHDKLYVCHDYATAYGLYLMNKKYIFVVHTQGSRIDEKIALGESITKHEMSIIQKCEKLAVENAVLVCFPSKGAENSFFASKYIHCRQYNNGPTLYNTIYADVTPKKISSVKKEPDTITFISVGTITSSKGQDEVVRFFHNTLDKTDKRIRWICVGKGPNKDTVYESARLLEQEYSSFSFVPFDKLTYAEVQYLYSVSDVYIMLHRLSVFDLSTLEAMKNGCALILSDVGGNKEYNVRDNVIFSDSMGVNSDRIFNVNEIQDLKQRNIEAFDIYFSKSVFKNRYSEMIIKVIDEMNASMR